MSDAQDWLAKGHDEVLLPSGRWALLKRPDAADLLLRDLLPSKLRSAVLATNGDQKQVERHIRELVPDEAAALELLVALRERSILGQVRFVRDKPTDPWRRFDKGLTDGTPVELSDLPADDVDALAKIFDYSLTPRQVTAIVQRGRDEISDDEAAAIVDEEEPRSTEPWDSFRHNRARPDAGGPGQDVGPTAIGPNRAQRRSRDRARAG
jgi:hypothetical protein